MTACTLQTPAAREPSATPPAVRTGHFDALDYALKAAAIKRVGRKRRRVVFLVHAAEIFSAIEPVISELRRRDDRFEVIVIALPRNYSGKPGVCGHLKETYEFLQASGQNPIAMSGQGITDLVRLVNLAPDFIFRQTPWEHHIPSVFSSRLLSFAQLCYVPYGMGTVEKPEHQYNQPFHNQCDLVFAESQYHLERYGEHRALGTQGVVLSGYPRFERFVQQLDEQLHPWPLSIPDDMPRVIWAPHHTVQRTWLNYSTFVDYKDLMLAEARRARISILFRPHPALGEKLVVSNQMTTQQWASYQAEWDAIGSSGIDRGEGYVEQFGASDLLITDGLGFFSEYLLTGKPLVRTWKAGAEPMNAFGEWCAQSARVVRDAKALQDVLDELGERRYEDEQVEMRLERRSVLVAMCQGAAARIVDTLENC